MEQTQRNLSSMVVRLSEKEGGESDVEPGEVRVDRYSENPGYGMRLGSLSPLPHRKSRQYDSDFDHSMGPRRGRGGFRGSRGGGRYHDISPPNRGRGVGRSFARGIDGPKFGPGPFRGEAVVRNNPNVSPREGDWICSEPTCGNLNFARRTHCNNCRKLRFAPGNDRSTRQGYPSPSVTRGSPPPSRGPPPPRFSGPPINHGPSRDTTRYLSPPRDLGRGDSRAFRNGPPPPRHGGRFFDNLQEERNYGERTKFERPVPNDWGNRERAKDEFIRERRGLDRVNERMPPSPPPLPPPRGPWMRSIRERSRSPLRIPRKDYNQESFMVRGERSRSPIRVPRTDYNPESSYMVRGERSRSPIRGGPRKDYNHESSYVTYGRGNRRSGIGRGRLEASY